MAGKMNFSAKEKENGKISSQDIFISSGELERYYEGAVPVNLWLGLNIKKNVGLFDLIEKDVGIPIVANTALKYLACVPVVGPAKQMAMLLQTYAVLKVLSAA